MHDFILTLQQWTLNSKRKGSVCHAAGNGQRISHSKNTVVAGSTSRAVPDSTVSSPGRDPPFRSIKPGVYRSDHFAGSAVRQSSLTGFGVPGPPSLVLGLGVDLAENSTMLINFVPAEAEIPYCSTLPDYYGNCS